MTGSTDWLSAIGILLSGLILGFMFMYAFRKKGSATPAIDQHRLDLEAKRDALIAQLRDPDVTAEEKTRIELEAANVLRELDAVSSRRAGEGGAKRRAKGTQPAAQASIATVSAQGSTVKGFLWGVGTVAAIGGLLFYVNSTAKDRPADQQPQPMAAQQPPASNQQPTDPAIVQLEQQVKTDPDNAEKRIALARAYLDRENMMGVFEQTNAVLSKNPGEPRAQTYNAIVRMAMGQLDQASSMLESATKTDPKLSDAWVALAWVRTQRGDKTRAKAAIDSAIRNNPTDADRLRQVWTQMSAAPPAQTASAENPHANGGATPSGSAIHVTLSLDNAAAVRTGVVYVIARNEGQTAGPPVAVKRINATSFPITVDLSSADSMMGQPLPSSVSLEARLDSDGDAMTKGPNDPHAALPRVTTGANVALTLK